jgi:hypothetical protein
MKFLKILLTTMFCGISLAATAQTLPKYQMQEVAVGVGQGGQGGYNYVAWLIDRVTNAIWWCQVDYNFSSGGGKPITPVVLRHNCIKQSFGSSTLPELADLATAPKTRFYPAVNGPTYDFWWFVNQKTGDVTFCARTLFCTNLDRK